MRLFFWSSCLALGLLAGAGAQSHSSPARVGPAIGATAPSFTGVDQFGRQHTLKSLLGPDGLMLVFFRSADW